MKNHTFSVSILKGGDIRGVLGKDLTEEDAYFIGLSFGTWLRRRGKKRCVTGYDARLSSPALFTEASNGLTETGIDVMDIGLVPTPVAAFAVANLFPGGGMVITASHNPPEYNGFKFISDKEFFHGESLKELAAISAAGDFETGEGTITKEDVIERYAEYIAGFIEEPMKKSFTIVWDPGNGAASVTIPLVTRYIPGKHLVICGKADGTFPNHHPDPSKKENLAMLSEAVVSAGADLGIAFDGDGDRIGVVDGDGYPLNGDQLFAVFARDFLASNPKEKVMTEVKASSLFFNEVSSLGGEPVIWKVGHINQKQRMQEEGIKLAGETSGHIFFDENGGSDDAMFSAVKLINILSSIDESLAEIHRNFPVFHDSGEIRIPVPASRQDHILQEIHRNLRDENRDFLDIDGIRVSCRDGFWLIRKSNTEPLLTIRYESATPGGFEGCRKELQKLINSAGLDYDLH